MNHIPVEFQDKRKFTKSSIKPHEACTIVGKKGTGKSVLFDNLLASLSKKTLVVLIDSKREYKHLPVLNLEHLSYSYRKKDLKKVYAFRTGIFRAYQVNEVTDLFVITEWLSSIMFERENCILAIEELANCTKKWNRLYDCCPQLAKVVQQGRARNVGFLGTTQRLQEIHTTILSESDHIICFKLTSEQDEKYMKNYISPDRIRALKQHEFLHLNLKGDYLRHCHKLYLSEDREKYYTKIFGRS